jgi:hypothetical protein
MTEWRPVPGWEDLYLVSDSGDVMSLRTGRPMNPDSRKYLRVKLSAGGGQRKSYLVHRLVALAFLGPCPDGKEVRHLDGDNLNNRAANLAYGTSSENNLDRVLHGRHHNANKTHCKRNHPFDEVNTQYGADGSRHCRACHRAKDRAQKRRTRLRAKEASL